MKLKRELQTYLPKVAIGINWSEMISGNIGSTALKRLDFTIIGAIANTSQPFLSAAKSGQIVISKEIYENINIPFIVNLQP